MKRKPLLILLLLATSFPLATIAQDITLNSSQSIALTPGTTRNFYDSGGSSSNYSNSESYTLTLTNAGDITINFSSFTTESSSSCYDWDYMYIYDGTTSGTQLAKGQTGCSSANLTTGTNYTATSGTMTITWHSDGSTNAAGWAATITAASVPGLVPFVDGLETSTWYVVNGSCTNKWYLGSLGARYGTAGLYISNDDGTTNAYSTGSVSVVYAYKNITFPSAGKYNLSFDIKQNGESTYDCVGAMLYDASTTPSASTSSAGSGLTSFPSGYTTMITGVGSSFSGNAWKTSSTDFTVNAAGQYKLTFCWKNDGSGGSNPPAAIDNISVTKVNDVTAVTSPDGMGTMTTSLTWGFEDGSYQGWTVINNDSDAYPWITLSTLGDYTSSYNPSSDYSFWAHNGSGSVLSGSYINGIGALTNIDNYLVSPRLILGGSISFYAKSVDPDYPEQFGVAVCTSDNPTASNFSTIQTWTGASDRDWHLYTVDLSAYTDYGYVAIRNYGTTDQYMVIVDDITITSRSVSNFNRPLASGVSATFNVTPNSGVTFTQWTNNGATVSTSNSYTFTVQEPSALVAVMDVPATVPYTQDFESADHGWAMINGSCANKWYCGAPGGKSGGNGLYISSDNGTNNTYNNSSPTYVYTYKSLTFSEAGDYILLFDLRQQGESTWDCVGAMLYSSSTTPSPSTSYGSYGLDSWPSGYSQFIVGAGVDASGGNWAKISQTFTLSTAGTYKLVFGWKNDSSGGTNPPAAIDNVIVKKNPTYYNVAASANPNSAGNVKFLVGDGGTSTNSYLPCYTYYNYNLTQQIYTPLEIGNVGTINSIAFYNGGDTKTLTDLEFYMVHTFKDEFGNNSDWIPVTSSNLVFSGSNVEMTAGQWTIINLTTPFVYDGLSNLAIVTREHMQYDSGLGCRVFTPASGGNCSIYAYNDNNAYDVTNPSQYNGTRLTVKNQILVNPGGSLTRSFPEGATVTLVEELTNSDYHFENWTDNSSNAGNNEIYAISNLAGAHTVVANFAPNTHTLTASVSPANSGTISANGTNISGSVTYNHGTTVSLTATAASGYTFQDWTIDGSTVSGASTTVTMDQDHTVVANFTLNQYTVTLNVGTGGTATGGGTYNEGTTANIEAFPDECHTFSHFIDDNNTPIYGFNPAPITVDHNMTITVVFEMRTYIINASASPSAGGTVTGGGTLDCGSSCTLTATPATNYVFDNWTENGTVVSSNASYTFTVNGDRTLVANFHLDAVNITATAYDDSNNTTGGGTISGTGNIAIGTTCNLVATPGTGYEFVRWTENGSEVSTNATYSFTVSVARTLVAHFRLMDYTLTLAANPQAGGTVSANPAGPYHYNDVVTITATPNPGYTFGSWSDNGTQSHTVTINGNDSYTANFTQDEYTLTLNANPSAGGTLTASPSGPYHYGDQVTITATANSGYTFASWSDNGAAQHTVTITGNATYTATFTQDEYTLTLNANPSAGGTVSANPAQATYHYGDVVTITATPNSGYTFGSWSDGGAQSHDVTITGNATYTAYFGADHTLTTYADPIEGGYVTLAPVSDIGAVTIGTTDADQNNVSPFNSNAADYSFVECIYTASEINLPLGCTITSISYECATGTSQSNHIEVFMKHVSNTTFGGTTNLNPQFEVVTDNDKVFDGTWTITVPGSAKPARVWNTIVLDKPFVYNGTDHLMIGIHENTAGFTSVSFGCTTVTNSCASCYSSSGKPDDMVPTDINDLKDGSKHNKQRFNERANVRLGFGTYHNGQSVTLTAHPNAGYQFVNWTENNQQVGTAGNATYTVTMDTDHTIYAHFERALKRFVTDGYWNVAGNWDPVGVPTSDISEDISIEAHAIIPDGVVAYADSIRPITHANSSITIKDGGQLIHNSAGLSLTAEKDITGYTIDSAQTNWNYYLFSSPVIASATYTGIVTSEHYDFYRFDASHDPTEWRVSSTSDIAPYIGFIYASRTNTTITLSGTVPPSNTTPSHQLDYTSGRFIGWNLIGNPFVCNAYVTRSGNNIDYYVLNHQSNYDEFIARSSSDTIVPLGALMVKASASGQSVTYSRSKSSKGPGILNIDVRRTMERGSALLDRARVRFGEGDGLEKFQFNPNHTKVYIPDGDKDFAVYYAEGAGTIPVNFKAENNGRYTLDFSTEDVGFNYIHLIDNMNGNDVDLLKTPYYAFNAKSTDYASRFTIVFATGDSNDDNFAFYNNGLWIINNDGEATLQVVDALGRILSSETISGSHSKVINAAPGVYMFRLINGNDVKVQKIVVKR